MKFPFFRLEAFVFLAAAWTSAAEAGQADPSSLVGHYGFDWLRAGAFQCDEVSDKSAASFKTCWYYPPGSRGSFSGDSDFHTCVVDEDSEYMIYKTKERCDQELEIMRSGAP